MKPTEALTAYEESLAIRRRLAETDKSNNTKWQKKVLESLKSFGELKLKSGDSAGALICMTSSSSWPPMNLITIAIVAAFTPKLEISIGRWPISTRPSVLTLIHASCPANRGWTYWQKGELEQSTRRS